MSGVSFSKNAALSDGVFMQGVTELKRQRMLDMRQNRHFLWHSIAYYYFMYFSMIMECIILNL